MKEILLATAVMLFTLLSIAFVTGFLLANGRDLLCKMDHWVQPVSHNCM